MGYRSDVTVVFVLPTQEKFEQFKARCELELADLPDSVGNFWRRDDTFGHYESREADFVLIKQWEQIKWYTSFPEVHFIGIAKRICIECKGAWVFGRVGEEDDDLEYDWESFMADHDSPDEERDYCTEGMNFQRWDYLELRRSFEVSC
jgi:hypothetical protein